ncbi:hypothetical protein ES708_12724 [subsurface metagenome]
MRRYKPLYMFLVMFIVAGLSSCGSSPEDVVKTGTLKLDPSATVEDAFNGYQFFGKKSWKSLKDQQNREIVEFNGSLDFDKFVGAEMNGIQIPSTLVKKAKRTDFKMKYVAQFAISKNGNAFQLKYSGIAITGTNLKTGEPFNEDIADDDFSVLKRIYGNKPELNTLGVLFAIGGQDDQEAEAYNTVAENDLKSAYTAAQSYFFDYPDGQCDLSKLNKMGFSTTTKGVSIKILQGGIDNLLMSGEHSSGTKIFTMSSDGSIQSSDKK